MKRDIPYLQPDRRLRDVFLLLTGAGALTFAAGLFLAPQRIWPNALLASFYLLGLALGGLFFLAVQYVSGARWSTLLRRVPEAMASMLPFVAALVTLVVLLGASLYPWSTETEYVGFKALWLSRPFFILRTIFYLGLWIAFARAILRNSRQQDEDGDPAHTRRNTRLSAGFIVVFTVTFWPAAFDWIMSMDPEWYSTMFGVYNFASLFLGGLAAVVLLTIYLVRSGPFRDLITETHLYDLGKLLFGFSTFWMYIWFCQYMLIWYADLPEETGYFVQRMHGIWLYLFLLNPVLNWAIPFFVLLPIRTKQNAKVMGKVAIIVLIGHWLDLYLMIFPSSAGAVLGVWEIGMGAGAVGLFGLLFFRALRKAPVVPVRDPSLADSLHYHAG